MSKGHGMSLNNEVELNRNVIDLIAMGLEREAILLIEEASNGGLTTLEPPCETRDNANVTHETLRPFTVQSLATDGFMSASLFETRMWNRLAEPAHSFFTIFSQAFDFCPSPNGPYPPDVISDKIINLRIVTLYNAGLAFHSLAVRLPGSTATTSRWFADALAKYTASLQLIARQVRLQCYSDEMDILFMALTNNMGHCYARLHNTQGMMRCYHQLVLTFNRSNRKNNLTEEEFRFFMDRIRLGEEFGLQPAPAA